ncbi:MAG: UDP-N-acetylmuramate dehydrogenase [Chloroflexi bacterium]|nr:UDP-N-acetylmuramate dehydrogenase [Chloroflexota bacterium]
MLGLSDERTPVTDTQAAEAAMADALAGAAELGASLAKYSWVGVGGPADVLVIAHDRETLVKAVRVARELGLPWRVYGGLTNILVPDSGLRGAIILNRTRATNFEAGGRLVADAGAIVVKVAREAIEKGWGGLTWAVGLPGTIGGAVVNNAGAFGGEISRVLVAADVLAPGGDLERVTVDWFGFQYRCSKLKGAGERWVVLGAEFQLHPADPARLRAKADEYIERRQKGQPPGRTLGSTFKNPPGDYAGRLIDAAGLKGTRYGGIRISDHHANFFINDGEGTAADFRALVERVQSEVFARFGVRLEPEIEMLPEEPPDQPRARYQRSVGS